MVIRYPNGQDYNPNSAGHARKNQRDVIFGNRGMSLEEELNQSNLYYLQQQVAVIHKKPVPIQIVQVDYPRRSAAVIKEAYFKQASTTDYNGVYHGYYLDFEAKETRNKTSFPLNNFHEHQINHMKACVRQAGICFTIIKFSITQELFLLPAATLFEYWDQQTHGRKSIPKKIIADSGFAIAYQFQPLIPYLTCVDKLIENLRNVKGAHHE
ncbi:Holliday junction resolvase RecU [Liquorilactobacillus satsumensis]|uniref:Holliday junction resolvase RecU n=1 Tax=Liquorilactobacillus satsumensis DSM 16230 = JCM 12392 TaxID=1423801 RepID=A0A0R1VAD4_9LACO|nr:Holliday junction resolvase RecU [Liquorilactobacillus satsumensis]KRL99973.1 Holliday junction-specific endonuclease [Liquorilactobacillus satsumensis DSM 16230 = JCM 12392]MCC7665534.1 Holliday junction resolvase RecU [Liquorilactobacillus satsumensis]MCP9311747.1 Holliday junction resolvase RecU [Liquorilactobacillus satsumensis]MCP9328453.1 Holliday junction resolvase RecU [Liquorilactobacillus satsumensis]MCP9357291.1 Holliday junction resolvase RecU [Liquorilactobacillus satsumensis]